MFHCLRRGWRQASEKRAGLPGTPLITLKAGFVPHHRPVVSYDFGCGSMNVVQDFGYIQKFGRDFL